MNPVWIGTVCAVAGVLLAARPLRWAVRLLIGTHEFLIDWPRMKADIADLRNEVAAIKAETRPNGGNSMRDLVYKTAEAVGDIKHEQARIRSQIELRQPPPERM